MGRVTLRPAARADLIDIHRYIARESPGRADACLRRIDRALGTISDQPGIGAARLPHHPEIRVFVSGSHLLFYRILAGGTIDVVRVLHGARDWQALMDDELR